MEAIPHTLHPTTIRREVTILQLHDDALGHPGQDVITGLACSPQARIPSLYFYDKVGSELYEEITRLPEYYLTRLEIELLKQVIPQLEQWVSPREIVELGSGFSKKTRIVLDHWLQQRKPLRYIPIDISRTALESGVEALKTTYPTLDILGLVGRFEGALRALPGDANRLFLFLGSTIGNFTPAQQQAFFQLLAASMTPGSSLLIGFDRACHAEKPIAVIEQAYNDKQGITAQFNLNILAHLNHRFGADFDLQKWQHQAIYTTPDHQIEMSLQSLAPQEVTFSSLKSQYRFASGDRILTEISRKFEPGELSLWFETLGLICQAQWADASDYVGLMLLQKQ